MSLSGNVSTTSYEGRYITLSWSGTQDIANNKTVISWTLKGAGKGQAGWYMTGPIEVKINGDVVYSSSNRFKLYNGTVIKKDSKPITHNTDGKKSIKIEIRAAIYSSSYNKSGEKSFALDTIPRKATITYAPNFTDDENPKITYSNPAGTNVTKLEVGIFKTDGKTALVGYREVSRKGNTYTFSLTTDERNRLRNNCKDAKNMNVRFYIKTTIGSTTYLHYNAQKLTIANATPTIAPTAKGTGTYTGDINRWFKNEDTINCNFNCELKKGATIKNCKLICGTQSKDLGTSPTGTLENINDDKIQFILIDSRGYEVKKTISGTLINYVPLTCNIEVTPYLNVGNKDDKDEITTDSDSGEQVNQTQTVGNEEEATTVNYRVSAKGSFFVGNIKGGEENKLSLSVLYRVLDETNWNTVAPPNNYITINNNFYSLKNYEIKDLDYQKVYEFKVIATDNIKTITSQSVSVTAQPAFDWGHNSFNFNIPINCKPQTWATSRREMAGSNYTKLTTKQRYVPSGGALQLSNSDINGVNGLFFNYDIVDNIGEGIFFPLYPTTDAEKAMVWLKPGETVYPGDNNLEEALSYQRYGQLFINRSGNLRMILGIVPGRLNLTDMIQTSNSDQWWLPDSATKKYKYLVVTIQGVVTTDDTPYGDAKLAYKK